MTRHHLVAEHDQVQAANCLGNAKDFFSGKLRGMNTLPCRGVGSEHFFVSHCNLGIRHSLLDPVQRAVLADASAQLAVVACGDLFERAPQRHHRAEVMGNIERPSCRHLADHDHMVRLASPWGCDQRRSSVGILAPDQ
ncbi:hypothetical protein D3C77_496300 [compost metagenome]